MTLAEMASHITTTLGQTDASSVAACKSYIKRRYDTVWNAKDWRDARVHESLAFTAGTALVTLPATVDRVITVSVAATDTFLDPIDTAFLAETNASSILTSETGTPQYYEELTTSAGVHQLRLYPAPASNTTVTIVGKRVRPELSGDGSSPILRNLDDAIMAFASADMYERLRQLGRKNDKIQEAGALLDAAWKIETEQSQRRRRAKVLTASGNTLAEMADDVCARIGDFLPETYILVKQYIRRNYDQLWNSYLWKESRVVARKASDGTQLICPEYFGRVTALRANEDLGALSYVEAEFLATVTPSIFEETTGTQFGFTQMSDVAVKTLPPGLEKLSFQSTSASDAGTVYVFGEGDGAELSESVTLNGTTAVLTTNFYDTPLTITKPITVGDVVVKGATSTTELQRLLTTERERKHIRLWLHPTNTSGTTCLILGKRRISPLVNDQDTIMLRDAHHYIIEASTADAFSRFGKPNEAAEARAKAEDARKTLMSLETSQGANQQRVVPTVEPWSYDYAGGLYGKAYF